MVSATLVGCSGDRRRSVEVLLCRVASLSFATPGTGGLIRNSWPGHEASVECKRGFTRCHAFWLTTWLMQIRTTGCNRHHPTQFLFSPLDYFLYFPTNLFVYTIHRLLQFIAMGFKLLHSHATFYAHIKIHAKYENGATTLSHIFVNDKTRLDY